MNKASKSMAENYFLDYWVANGEPHDQAETVTNYLKKIKRDNSASVAFFVSGESKNYYTESGVIKTINRSTDGWFYKFLESGRDYELSFDVDNISGIPTVYVNYALSSNGQRSGVAGVGMTLEDIRTLINTVKIGETGKVFLVDGNGQITIHPDKDAEGSLEQY